jgi:diguanylate cyclase (GGDEF)-like protein/PAS domain S-box-containing protein
VVKAGLAHPAVASFQSGRELFEALAAHTPVGIFISSAEGGCLYVNERWCELTGLSPAQALGDGWVSAIHPDDAARVHREWAEAGAHGRDSVVEYRFVRPDGGVSWIEGYAATLRDQEGHVIGWVGTCLDFTARKEADEAVARAAQRFRVAFENAPIGMALLTPAGRWFEVNSALCEVLGYSEEQLLELTFMDVTHPDDRSTSIRRRHKQLNGREPAERIEKRYVRGDGSVVWVGVSSTLVRSAAGEPLYTVAQIEDITARVRVQRELATAEERFRRAFHDAPIGMALVDLEGRWLRVNPTLCELTGYTEGELLARTFQDITHPDDLEQNLSELQRVIGGELRAMRLEKRYLRANGHTVWVRISSSLVRDADGNPLHFVSQIENVTDRRRAEERLKELADQDSLTGLLNRRRFDEELRLTLLRLGRHGGHATLLLLDLDRFKLVNDTYGHKTGDEVLVAVGRTLRETLRETDVVARLGGDEFAVIALETGSAGALSIATDLATALRSRQIVSGDAEVTITASIGVVGLDQASGAAGDDPLVAADRALYRAKSSGRDRIELGA